jgi:hypothetical protein
VQEGAQGEELRGEGGEVGFAEGGFLGGGAVGGGEGVEFAFFGFGGGGCYGWVGVGRGGVRAVLVVSA